MDREDELDRQEKYKDKISRLNIVVGMLKREKKNAMSNLTRMLNQLVVLISDKKYDRRKDSGGNRTFREVER